MARHKSTSETDHHALAEYLAGRIATSVPSSATYRAAIADTLAVALADAAAGHAVPDPDSPIANHALDER